MTVFWGHTDGSTLSKLAPTAAKGLVGAAIVAVVLSNFAVAALIGGALALVFAAYVGLWSTLPKHRMLRVELGDGQLRFGDGGRHTLGPGSLAALRTRKDESTRTEVTVVQVRLDSGQWRVLRFMDLVADDRYTSPPWQDGNIRFMPDQNELLQSLQPYLARGADGDATEPGTYTIPLSAPIAETSAFDALIITGEKISLMKRGRTVASAEASAIGCKQYAFFEVLDPTSHPEGRCEPALELSFPESGVPVSVTVGAHVAWSCSLGAGLPRGEPPYFLIGAAELVRLKTVLKANG